MALTNSQYDQIMRTYEAKQRAARLRLEKKKADIDAAGEKDKEPEEKQTVQESTGLSTGNAEVDRILGLR